MTKSKNQTETQTQTETPAPAKTKVAIAKKVTVKDVFGSFNVDKIPANGELPLCRLAGVARGVKSGVSQYGNWDCLIGDFAGTNKETGEITVASNCIVPGAMGEALVTALKTAQLEDAAAEVSFSVDVSAKVSQRDEKTYEYIVRPVIAGTALENRAVAMLALEN